ncbi:MAG: tetratricopeptide repeat protein, partial [Spirochaetia bacterium]|nr:tetratricopeptide repeat protein [Spirochaetia bacterium]
LAPESAVYFYFKGLEAYSQNRKLVALGLMRQAITTDTNFSPAQNMTGLLLMDAGRAADALAFFVIAVQRSPHDPIYLYNLALCQIALDQKEKALVHLTRALEAKANFAEAAFWKGNLLLRSGQIQAAYNSLSSSIEFGITDPRAYVDFFKVAEDLDKEVRLLEVLDLLLEARDAPRLRVAADMSTRYAEWDRADAFFVRLLSLPDAAKEDRRKYMEMLYAANRNPAIWVRNVRIEESERNELLGYLRELSSKGPAFPARDPVARPGR